MAVNRPRRRTGPGVVVRLAEIADLRRQGAPSRRDAVSLASTDLKAAVRVTGGAALLGTAAGPHVGRMLAQGLGGPQASAAVLAGATTPLGRPTPGSCERCDQFRLHCEVHCHDSKPLPSVTQVLDELAAMGAPARTIGVVPTINRDIRLYCGTVLVSDQPEHDWYTIVDERCPVCLLVYLTTDQPQLTWDDEWKVCLEYLKLLREDADFRTLHLVCNGGPTTRNEVTHVAGMPPGDNPWNILLLEDAGRLSTELAADRHFRAGKDHIVSCRMDELATVIRQMGFAPDSDQEG